MTKAAKEPTKAKPDSWCFLVVDTETTGLDHSKDRVVEVGAVLTDLAENIDVASVLVNPGIPIPPAASAIHHLTDEDVAQALPLEDALGRIGMSIACHAYVAHNAPFDRGFLAGHVPARPWIDTKRLAQKVLPDLEAHNNQFLRYALKLDVPAARGLPAHRALADALVTAALLRYLLTGPAKEKFESMSIEDFCKWIEEPLLLTRPLKFGKHAGKQWSELPVDYLAWIDRKATELDADTMFTARYWLAQKQGRLLS